jgi:hypothetical protein
MLLKESVLIYNTNDITSSYKRTFFKASHWFEVPFFVLIKAWKLNTSWDEDALVSSNSDFFKWSLDTIENCFQNTCNYYGDKEKLIKEEKNICTYLVQVLQKVAHQFSRLDHHK